MKRKTTRTKKLNAEIFERAAEAFMLNTDGAQRNRLGNCGACYALAGVLDTKEDRANYYTPYHNFFNYIMNNNGGSPYFGGYCSENREARILALLWCAQMVRALLK